MVSSSSVGLRLHGSNQSHTITPITSYKVKQVTRPNPFHLQFHPCSPINLLQHLPQILYLFLLFKSARKHSLLSNLCRNAKVIASHRCSHFLPRCVQMAWQQCVYGMNHQNYWNLRDSIQRRWCLLNRYSQVMFPLSILMSSTME